MRAFPPILALILFANCASQSDALQQRLTMIKEYHRSSSVGVGRIYRGPGDTLVSPSRGDIVEGQPSAYGVGGIFRFQSLKDGQICFVEELTRMPEVEAAKAYGGKVMSPLELVQKEVPVVEAFTSLREVPPRPAYVPASGSVLSSVEAVSDESRTKVTENRLTGEKQYDHYQDVSYRLCGKAPAITPQTRYLTVAHLVPGEDEDHIQLFLWAIVDAPAGEYADPPPVTLDF